ncbi:Hoc-like head decoration [Salmonella phage Shivani]|uniref:Tail protein n=1 Tax=Salmonella phage Shivani TaxID=1572715 RepID=A0A0A7TYJ2_9CAUD|nr:Hoc-like head decoration [Salmonella phage Shivani]AJA73588.1 tail protein [Salmonella phage Shivani]
MIDYNGLKTIFGEKLPESHIFFATVAAHKFVPNYATLRKELGMTTAHTNRKVWNKFKEAYEASAPAVPALSFTKNLAKTLAVEEGAAINLSVTVTGGTAPYTYAWTKDGVPLSGATGAAFSKVTAATEDAGTYKVVVTDSKSTSITSNECVTTVNPTGG